MGRNGSWERIALGVWPGSGGVRVVVHCAQYVVMGDGGVSRFFFFFCLLGGGQVVNPVLGPNFPVPTSGIGVYTEFDLRVDGQPISIGSFTSSLRRGRFPGEVSSSTRAMLPASMPLSVSPQGVGFGAICCTAAACQFESRAPMFSLRCSRLRVPGIGTMKGYAPATRPGND